MLYLVTMHVDREREREWLDWMVGRHVPAVLATGAFTGATVTADPAEDSPTRSGYRILYRARSRAALDRYVSEHAPALRREHNERFGGAFDATRDVLEVVADLSPT